MFCCCGRCAFLKQLRFPWTALKPCSLTIKRRGSEASCGNSKLRSSNKRVFLCWCQARTQFILLSYGLCGSVEHNASWLKSQGRYQLAAIPQPGCCGLLFLLCRVPWSLQSPSVHLSHAAGGGPGRPWWWKGHCPCSRSLAGSGAALPCVSRVSLPLGEIWVSGNNPMCGVCFTS